MLLVLIAFLVAASIAAALTPFSKWVALRVGAVDKPDARKVHQGAMPRMGGLAIVAAVSLPVCCFAIVGMPGLEARGVEAGLLFTIIPAGLIIALVGALDDIRPMRARNKFGVQLIVAVVAWAAGIRFDHVGIPFLGVVDLPIWVDLPITVLWIAGIINAINLIDGLDGLAAGVTFFVASTNLVLALRGGDDLAALMAAIIAGSVLGFLLFNWNPAIIFMGDTGSMFLGFMLATTSIMTSQKTSTAVAMIVPIIALGVPVLDTLMSMIRRFLEKRPLFSPDKGHLHHRLLRIGLTQRRAVLVIYGLTIIFAGVAIAMSAARDVQTAVAMGILAVVTIGIIRFFGFFQVKKAVKGVLERNHILERLRPRLPEFSARVMGAESADEVWDAFHELGEALEFREISWTTVGLLPCDARSQPCLDRECEEYPKLARKGFNSAKSTVVLFRPAYLEMKVVYPATLGKIGAETDSALDLIADALGSALVRLREKGLWSVTLATEEAVCAEPEEAPEAGPSTPSSDARQDSLPGGPAPTEQRETAGFDENGSDSPVPACLEPAMDGVYRSEVLNEAWETLVQYCGEAGFCSIDWRTCGLKPVDSRSWTWTEEAPASRSVFSRSIPITQTAFIELKLGFPGKTGESSSDHVRHAIRTISTRLNKILFSISRLI